MKEKKGIALTAVEKIDDDDLAQFRKFLSIDLHLSARTVEGYSYLIKRYSKLNQDHTTEGIREFLSSVKDKEGAYPNYIKALRRFFRDYKKRPDLVASFRFPASKFNPIEVPTKADLREYYSYIKRPTIRALFLVLASSGLRLNEVLSLTMGDVDFTTRTIRPKQHSGKTKSSWISFFNQEAEQAIMDYLKESGIITGRIFPISDRVAEKNFLRISKASKIKITPRKLRAWFSTQLADLGVPDRYVDALTGHTPKSILAKHYTDYSPTRLRETYERAGLKVLEESKPKPIPAPKVDSATATKRTMTLDMMKDAMSKLRQQIYSLERRAADEEGKKSAEEMKGLWSTIDFLKGQLRSMEEEASQEGRSSN
jgi:integrase